MNLAQLVDRAASLSFDTIATISSDGTERTWGEVEDRVGRFAAALRSLGVAPGDRVALLGLNSASYLEAMFAVFRTDAVIVPMNSRWNVNENIFCLKDCRAKLLIVDGNFADQAAPLALGAESVTSTIYLDGLPSNADGHDYEALIGSTAAGDRGDRHGQDLAGIFYTGGTTGFPKGVMLSHANLLASSLAFWLSMPEMPRNVIYLHVAPMFHLADASQSIGVTLQHGTHLFMSFFDAALLIETVRQQQVTDVILVPTMIEQLLDAAQTTPDAFDSLKRLIYGGSPISPATLARLRAIAPHVDLAQCYGQTEMAPTITVLTPADHRDSSHNIRRLASAGRPAFDVEVRIVGDDFASLPVGQVGQVMTRGRNAMLGYWEREEQSRAALVDGWVATGDAGYLDDDGFLYLVDRYKDMIVSGGENVYSVEVEKTLSLHPAVKVAAVIGIPSPQWGEAVHAFIVTEDELPPSPQELITHCKSHIAGYKAPKSIEFVSSLPVSAAGKVQKVKLREKYWSGGSNIA